MASDHETIGVSIMSSREPRVPGFLTLEPLEGEFSENRVFGDFSSRDRNSPASKKKENDAAVAKSIIEKIKTPAREGEKPSGQAVFDLENRKTDRRKNQRRAVSRLAKDRRSGIDRRGRICPWAKEFRR